MFGMVVFHECLKYTEEPRLKEVVIIEDRAQIAITSRYGQYPGFVKVIEQEQGAVVTRIVRPIKAHRDNENGASELTPLK